MKVLYFVHTAYPEANGIAIHLHYLQKNLAGMAETSLIQGRGIAIPGFSSMRVPLMEFFRGFAAPCDLVHVHGYSLFTAAGAILARLRGKPFVWTVHGVPKFSDRRKWLLGLYNFLFLGWLKSADAIISVSHDERVGGWEKAGRPINYLPNGVDTDLFKPASSYRQSRHAGYFGRLDKDKGVEELMQIKSFPLLLAGPDEGMLEKLKSMGELQYRQARHEDMPALYNQCRYVLLPSRYEGYPLTMLEALACERPFVARPVGEIPAVMQQLFGEKWKKYMIEGSELLESRLARLEKENLEQELKAARKAIEQTLSWKVVAGQTFGIYEKTLEKKKR
ncbi:MAG: glycosyltransferase family 4 protein [Candidatus Marsarchaeota archaeon]|nr:glycosyltransferase family 4 protein [Candidatus Marsarchaeota archaeon]